MPSYRATILCRFGAGAGTGTNTWHFRTGADALPDDDLSPLLGYIQAFYTAVRTIVPTTYSWSWDGSVTEVLTDAPAYVAAGTGWTVTGSATNGSYGPAAGMACVTWRSELNTRSGRGRTFLGPLAASAVESNGTLSESALTALRNAANGLVSQSNTNDNVGAIGVFSPTQNILRDIVAASVTDQVAVLRSRRS